MTTNPKEVAENSSKSFNVLLFGETGSGKTTFLSVLAFSLPKDRIASDHYLRSLAERLRHEESVEATRRQEERIKFDVIDPRTNGSLSVTVDDQVGEDCRKFASFHTHDQNVSSDSETEEMHEELKKIKGSIQNCDAVILLVNLYGFSLLERCQVGRWFQSNAWFINILGHLHEYISASHKGGVPTRIVLTHADLLRDSDCQLAHRNFLKSEPIKRFLKSNTNASVSVFSAFGGNKAGDTAPDSIKSIEDLPPDYLMPPPVDNIKPTISPECFIQELFEVHRRTNGIIRPRHTFLVIIIGLILLSMILALVSRESPKPPLTPDRLQALIDKAHAEPNLLEFGHSLHEDIYSILRQHSTSLLDKEKQILLDELQQIFLDSCNLQISQKTQHFEHNNSSFSLNEINTYLTLFTRSYLFLSVEEKDDAVNTFLADMLSISKALWSPSLIHPKSVDQLGSVRREMEAFLHAISTDTSRIRDVHGELTSDLSRMFTLSVKNYVDSYLSENIRRLRSQHGRPNYKPIADKLEACFNLSGTVIRLESSLSQELKDSLEFLRVYSLQDDPKPLTPGINIILLSIEASPSLKSLYQYSVAWNAIDIDVNGETVVKKLYESNESDRRVVFSREGRSSQLKNLTIFENWKFGDLFNIQILNRNSWPGYPEDHIFDTLVNVDDSIMRYFPGFEIYLFEKLNSGIRYKTKGKTGEECDVIIHLRSSANLPKIPDLILRNLQ